jgi:hypothetical protein
MKYIIALITLLLAGCSTSAYLYPVSGPLSKQVPLPVLKATVDGIMGNTGNIYITLPSGEKLSGRWASMAPMEVGYSYGSGSGYATNGMQSVWTQVYGSTFTVKNKAGVNKGEAFLTGSNGTSMQVEFYTGSGTANGTGVAKDSLGNVYKTIF